MADYIERKAALDVYNEEQKRNGPWLFEDLIKSIPSANVREDVQARWIERDYKQLEPHGLEVVRTGKAGLCCSNCRHVFRKDLLWCDNFCPNCGARMDGESHE